MPADKTTVRKSRRFRQYSLRGLFLFLTVAALGFGWLLHRAEKQRRAVAAIRQIGGRVYYDFEQNTNSLGPSDAEPPTPNALRDLLGIDFFHTVIGVRIFSEDRIDVSALRELPDLERLVLYAPVNDVSFVGDMMELKYLHLSGSSVSDLPPLNRLTKLQVLELRECPISDVTPLGGLSALEDLDISGTQVSDLSSLPALPALRVLYAQNSPLRQLPPMATFENLQTLDLRATQVRDLATLEHMPSLARLYLDDSPVQDLSPLRTCPKLSALSLERTEVSDLSPLADLKKLSRVYFSDTHFTEAAVEELRRMLPNCEVVVRSRE